MFMLNVDSRFCSSTEKGVMISIFVEPLLGVRDIGQVVVFIGFLNVIFNRLNKNLFCSCPAPPYFFFLEAILPEYEHDHIS